MGEEYTGHATAMDAWEKLLWISVCALFATLISIITIVLMGRWPMGYVLPPVSLSPAASAPVAAAPMPVPAPSAVAGPPAGALDVLAELTRPHMTPYVPRTPSQSKTLADALQRAIAYPVFEAFLSRHDPEGLIEAAAWATACQREVMPDSARCNDARLHEPGYADKLLTAAAAAGQPGAIIELAHRYPLMWSTIPLDGGVMLDDAVFVLGSHGDVTALALLRQLCTVPDACRDAPFTRDVLTVMVMRLMRVAIQPSMESRQPGRAEYWQRVTARATQVLTALKL
ncbi:hypothetical protein [Burkholderia ubonensis]|uniref:hypothetical protein n=1 Tax=Burkholderia ubonensis TaxID=101571 RepID=UPI0007540292|nr:hypothetical protein [Burkholderia ubonensis]KWN80133.1 hypothetical protein WM23_22245 [Burkholderia ubonensis]